MKLQEIFDTVGLTRDQIRAVVSGKQGVVLVPKTPPKTVRPTCLVCGQRISKYTCRAIRPEQRRRRGA